MAPKHLFILLLALFASSVAQNDDELHIPVENDNQFPPDNHSDLDLIPAEGSGAGVIEEPLEATTGFSTPLLEDVQLSNTLINNDTVETAVAQSCPSPCVCNIEGDSTKYVVDCSNSGLTEMPKSLDPKTTELNLQNNKITEVPKDISALKDLKILNINNNEIMDVKAGSISELPQLTSLKLGNNRLIEFPVDLKNSFGLTKLEELDLGGNDMRTVLKPETFSNFKSLKKLVLPSAASNVMNDVCASLKESLETVCAGSCDTKSIDCVDAPHNIDEDLLDFALPGLIALGTEVDENADPTLNFTPGLKVENDNSSNATSLLENIPIAPEADLEITTQHDSVVSVSDDTLNPENVLLPSNNNDTIPAIVDEDSLNQENFSIPPTARASNGDVKTETPVKSEENTKTSEDTATASDAETSFRSAVIKASAEEIKPAQEEPASKITTKTEDVTAKTEGEVVGATTANSKTGGVDKSVIGIIVAGMVVVIAAITIKKNWSSIRNRFSSSPRNAHDRTGVNANGTAPEEVPLQEKSPV